MTGPQRPFHRQPPRAPRRPYDAFVQDVYATLLREVELFATVAVRGGLPAGFEARDFVQHGLLKLLDSYDRVANEAAAYVYARNAAFNALRDALRAAERRNAPEWLAGVAAAHAGSQMAPEAAVALADRRSRVTAALARLPERQQQAVRLLYMEGFSRHEAAKIMGLSESAVKSLAQRARVTLTALLKGASVVVVLRGALRRAQRPAAAAGALPRVAAVLCLTVVQAPLAPLALPAPHAEAWSETVAPAPALLMGPRVATARVTSAPARVTPEPKRRPGGSPALVPPLLAGRPLPPPPVAGGCVGETCLLDHKKGDELCVDTGQEPVPLCANQDVVGVCPTADRFALPSTRCRRHSKPTLDP